MGFLLATHARLMQQRDVMNNLTKTEENHRDSLCIAILENLAILPSVEL